MKKGVALILVALLLLVPVLAKQFTGMQVLDLPPPPPPPGSADSGVDTSPDSDDDVQDIYVPPATSQAQQLLDSLPSDVTALEARVETVEGQLDVVALVPQFESRLNTVERQAAVASEVAGKVETLESQLSALKVSLQNLQQRPYVERPAFTGSISAVQSTIKKSSILSISLSVVTLLIVIAVILYAVHSKHLAREEDKAHLVQYISNYLKQGYKQSTLKSHLLASGWDEQLVDEAFEEKGKYAF